MPRIAARTLLLLAVTLLPAYGFAEDALPKGKDYPAASVYTGQPPASVDRSDEFTNSFRTRFKEAMQGPVVFAGEYARTAWGCGGSGCSMTAFISKRTGRALDIGFTVYYIGEDNDEAVGEEIVYMKQESNLLVTYGRNEDEEKPSWRYYVVRAGKLALIKQVEDVEE